MNEVSIQLEHAGYSHFEQPEWQSRRGLKELSLSAQLSASLAKEYHIPLVWLTTAQVAAGAKGFCTHNDVTIAFHHVGGHTDPGPNFPKSLYMQMVQKCFNSG